MNDQKGPDFPEPTTLTTPFLASDTTIHIGNSMQVPDAPNEVQIDAEQPLFVTYTGKTDDGLLTGVTRNDGSFLGDVPAGTEIASYFDMRNELDAISKSSLPNEQRLAGIAHMVGWNDEMATWAELPSENLTELQQKRLDRYYKSYDNNRRVVWDA